MFLFGECLSHKFDLNRVDFSKLDHVTLNRLMCRSLTKLFQIILLYFFKVFGLD